MGRDSARQEVIRVFRVLESMFLVPDHRWCTFGLGGLIKVSRVCSYKLLGDNLDGSNGHSDFELA